ncbi:MAG: hypothetical protein UH854_04100 [Clostridia bacterium]|nr:hypothetical protein [Clostridia bacterium]
MKIEFLTKIKGGRQDGAIWGGFYFSFNSHGVCTVYEVDKLSKKTFESAEIFAEFTLDKQDIIEPHSNSVAFGSEYFDKDDEFPLLYTNIYNNYSKCEDKLKGVCLVYRIQRDEKEFKSTLVQIIEIGFVEDGLWKSVGEQEDVRPYGNFTVDRDSSILYAFTMRDNDQTTRYFSFYIPKLKQGEICEKYGVNKVVLNKEDIIDYFDCPYQRYVQGACCNKGMIYSLEGFTDSENNPPAIRIVDTKARKEVALEYFKNLGNNIEPEMIDFDDGLCYYTDHSGNVHKIII